MFSIRRLRWHLSWLHHTPQLSITLPSNNLNSPICNSPDSQSEDCPFSLSPLSVFPALNSLPVWENGLSGGMFKICTWIVINLLLSVQKCNATLIDNGARSSVLQTNRLFMAARSQQFGTWGVNPTVLVPSGWFRLRPALVRSRQKIVQSTFRMACQVALSKERFTHRVMMVEISMPAFTAVRVEVLVMYLGMSSGFVSGRYLMEIILRACRR